MSSRVMGADEGASAEKLVWRPAAPEIAPEPPAASTPPGEPAEPPPEFTRQLEELRQEAERRAVEARQSGFQEGEAAGRCAAELELRPVVERLAKSIEELAGLRPAAAAHAETGLLKLATAIARRILHREISVDPQAVEGLVRVALERVRAEDVLRVRVHPEHAALLKAALDRLPGARDITVQPDGQLDRGGVVLETARGNLDASIETQLVEIERGLTDRLRGRV
jgi:flagellar assembly protein FliH